MPTRGKKINTDPLAELSRRVDELAKAQPPQPPQPVGQSFDLSHKAQTWLRLAQAGGASSMGVYRSTTFSGPTGAFAPGDPMIPLEPEVEPRLFEYGIGSNLMYIPRAGYGMLDFRTLRNLSILCKEIRLNIEKTKQIIRGLDWEIIFEGSKVEVAGETFKATPDIKRIANFWQKPDGVHDFDAFLAIMVEEMLVTDALTLYPNYSPEGFLLEIVDGTTIRPLIDFHGRIPRHPAPAYLQVLYGMPRSYYTAERLSYSPRNPKVNTVYGESPIEWILQIILQSIKHDIGRTNYFTEGNIPGAFAGLPSDWTPQQIIEFTEWYNALIAGDDGRAYKLMFLPHDGSSLPVTNFVNSTYEDVQLDEWLMTVACWAFGNSPTEFGLTRGGGSGLGGAGYMEGGENAQYRGSIAGLTQFIKRVIDGINRDFLDAPWAHFKWKGLEPAEDETKEADIHLKYINVVYTAEYVADQLGIPQKYRIVVPPPSPTDPNAAAEMVSRYKPTVPAVPNTAVATPSKEEKEKPSDLVMEKALDHDFKIWQERALRFQKKGWDQQRFTSDVIPKEILISVNSLMKSNPDPISIKKILQDARSRATLSKQGNPYLSLIDPATEEFRDALAEHFLDLQFRIEKAAEALR